MEFGNRAALPKRSEIISDELKGKGPWVTVAIKQAQNWVSTVESVSFRKERLLLVPATVDDKGAVLYPMVALSVGDRMSFEDGFRIINGFMSSLAWATNSAVVGEPISGSGRYPMFQIGADERSLPWPERFYQPYLPDPDDSLTRRALALYREGLSANGVAYQTLNFFKVVNLFKAVTKEQADWIDANWESAVRADSRKRFEERWPGATKEYPTIGSYLIYRNRCAIAHSFDSAHALDPDDRTQIKRLHSEVDAVRNLAAYAIRVEIGLKSAQDIWHEHLYELAGFKQIVGDGTLAKIVSGEPLTPADVPPFPPLRLHLVHNDGFPYFERLETVAVEQRSKILVLHLHGADGLLEMMLGLDFENERLEIDPEHALRVANDDTIHATEVQVSSLRFRDKYLGNGILEIYNADTGELLGRKDGFLPVNVDMQGSHENFERAIAANEGRLHELRSSAEAFRNMFSKQ